MKRVLLIITTAYGKLPKSIYVLFFATIINLVGGFVMSFLALLLKSALGYSIDTVANYIIITGVSTTLAPIIGGYLGDRTNKKNTYVRATIAGCAFLFVCGFLTESYISLIPILMIISSFFYSMANPILNAMIADICPDEVDQKRAFNLMYMGMSLGLAFGGIIGGRLMTNYLKWFFFIDGITTAISVILILLYVKDVKPSHSEVKVKSQMVDKSNPIKALLSRKTLVLFILFSLFGYSLPSQLRFGLQEHVLTFFGKETAPEIMGNIVSVNALVIIFLSVFVNNISLKFKPIKNVIFGTLLTAIGFVMYAFIQNILILYYVSVIIWTVGQILTVTNSTVYIMQNTPINQRARFGAMVDLIRGTAIVLSPKLMSFFILNIGISMSWVAMSSLCVIGLAGLTLIMKHDKKFT